MLKLLLPILLGFLQPRNNLPADFMSVSAKAEEVIRTAIRREALAIAMRIFGGIILSGVIIYSLVCVGEQINDLLLIMDFGPYYSLIGYSVLALLCIVGLFLLFKQPRHVAATASQAIAPRLRTSPPAQEPGLHLPHIMLSFYDGFNKGINQPRRRHRRPQTQIAEMRRKPEFMHSQAPVSESWQSESSREQLRREVPDKPQPEMPFH